MKHWLVKSEPNVFSVEDLEACPDQTRWWKHVRNYQARNFMRDDMQIGDRVFFYHSNTDIPAIVGVRQTHADPWDEFHGGLATSLAFDRNAITNWAFAALNRKSAP